MVRRDEQLAIVFVWCRACVIRAEPVQGTNMGEAKTSFGRKLKCVRSAALSSRSLPTRTNATSQSNAGALTCAGNECCCHGRGRVSCLLEFFDDEVALRGDDIAADPAANDVANTLRDARLALHQGMQIVSVEHQQARARDAR